MNNEIKQKGQKYLLTQRKGSFCNSQSKKKFISSALKSHLLVFGKRIHISSVSQGDILEKLRKLYNIKGTSGTISENIFEEIFVNFV